MNESCAHGYRQDDFLLFVAQPCGLWQQAHYAMCWAWFFCNCLVLFEASIVLLKPSLIEFKIGSSIILWYMLFNVAMMFFLLVVMVEPYASVTVREQALLLLISITIASSAYLKALGEFAIQFLEITNDSLLLALHSTGLVKLRFSQWLRLLLLYIIPSLNLLGELLSLVVIPAVFTDPNQQFKSVNAGLIIFGGGLLIAACTATLSFLRIRKIIVDQLKFRLSLANTPIDDAKLTSLANRTGLYAFMIGCNGLVSCLFFIVAGSTVGFRYWVAHTILGPLAIFTALTLLYFFGWPSLALLRWRLNINKPEDSSGSNQITRSESQTRILHF